MHQSKKLKQYVTQKDLEEVDLSLHEIVTLVGRRELSRVFGLNGSDKNIPIRRIKSQLTGTYDDETGEIRCDFNTTGIQEMLGPSYKVEIRSKDAPTGLRYYLYIEPRGEH